MEDGSRCFRYRFTRIRLQEPSTIGATLVGFIRLHKNISSEPSLAPFLVRSSNQEPIPRKEPYIYIVSDYSGEDLLQAWLRFLLSITGSSFRFATSSIVGGHDAIENRLRVLDAIRVEFPRAIDIGKGKVEKVLLCIIEQLLKSLYSLHSRLFMHGTLTPECIRVEGKLSEKEGSGENSKFTGRCDCNCGFDLQIVDYGLSQLLGSQSILQDGECIRYVAPEVLLNEPNSLADYFDPKRDIWSVGIIICELIGLDYTKRFAFNPAETFSVSGGLKMLIKFVEWNNQQNDLSVSASIIDAITDENHLAKLHPDISDLLTRALYIAPRDRDSASELLEHPCIASRKTRKPSQNLRIDVDLWSANDLPYAEVDTTPYGTLHQWLCCGGEYLIYDFFPSEEWSDLNHVINMPSVYMESKSTREIPIVVSKTSCVVSLAELKSRLRNDHKKKVVPSTNYSKLESRSRSSVASTESERDLILDDVDPPSYTIGEDSEVSTLAATEQPLPTVASMGSGEMNKTQTEHPHNPKLNGASYLAAMLLSVAANSSETVTPVETNAGNNSRENSNPDDLGDGMYELLQECLEELEVAGVSVGRQNSMSSRNTFKRRATNFFSLFGELPTPLRPVVWPTSLGVRLRPWYHAPSENPYRGGIPQSSVEDKIIWANLEGPVTWPHEQDRQLANDIKRCHQYHHLMKSSYIRDLLKQILKAWIILHPEYAYWQGLDSVAAAVVCVFPTDPSLCFSFFCRFVDTFLKGVFAGENKVELDSRLGLFWQYLAFHDAELWLHLKTLDVKPELFAIKWMLTLFAHVLPFEQVWCIWDALILSDTERYDSFGALFGVCLMVQVRSVLLQLKEFGDIMTFLTKLPLALKPLVGQSLAMLNAVFILSPTGLAYSASGFVPELRCGKGLSKVIERCLVVDVRPNEQYTVRRIRGAVNVGANDVDSGVIHPEIFRRRLDRKKQIVLVYGLDNNLVDIATSGLLKAKTCFVAKLVAEIQQVFDYLEDQLIINNVG